jgi:ferredoxin-NADP reductase
MTRPPENQSEGARGPRDGTARHKARITHVEACGSRYVLVSCTPPRGFTWISGQHLEVTLADEDGAFARLYSIASAASDRRLDFCVALGGDGRAAAVWRGLSAGDELVVGEANGTFRVPAEATEVVFVAGGSGVAPIRALLREALGDPADDRKYVLVYGCADVSAAPYATEFLDWVHTKRGRFVAVLVAERGDAPGFSRGNVLTGVAGGVSEVESEASFGVCGPKPMVDAVAQVLAKHGIGAERIFSEAF